MSRLADYFSRNRQNQKKIFIPYLMAGDPSDELTVPLMHALADNGAGIIEIGFPFSDPTADGPTIQKAAERALANGMTLRKTIALCAEFRQRDHATPLILMGYANPVMQYGYNTFASDLKNAGIDGIIIVDMPPEEEQEMLPYLQEYHIDMVRLLAPTTKSERLSRILQTASGFVYVISIKGITGTHSADKEELKTRIAEIRNRSSLPIVTGFGIKHQEQVKEYATLCDGVVVGSALVEHIIKTYDDEKDILSEVANWCLSMTEEL